MFGDVGVAFLLPANRSRVPVFDDAGGTVCQLMHAGSITFSRCTGQTANKGYRHSSRIKKESNLLQQLKEKKSNKFDA